MSPDSISALDQALCEKQTGATKAARRVVMVADLLSLVASDLAAAASEVMRSSMSVFGLFPLRLIGEPYVLVEPLLLELDPLTSRGATEP